MLFRSLNVIRRPTRGYAVLLVAVASVSVLSCTRKPENSSQVIVRLPASTQSEAKDHFAKIAKLEAMSVAGWGIAHPASLAETKCFAVVVEIPEGSTSTLATQQCTVDSAPEKNIAVSQFAGLAPAGSEIELNVAPGPDRTFHLFAFAAESSGECQITTVGSLIRKTSLSGPLHIGSKKANIVSGINNIEITGSFVTSTAYDNCEWQTPPPLTGGTFTLNSGANYTNSLNVTITNSLPFIASEAYYTTNSTCSGGGTWQPYSPTTSGFALTSGDGPKSVYAKFRDSSGSVSSCLSNAIILDQTAPAISLTPASDVNALSVSTFGFSGTCSDDGLAVNWTIGAINGSTVCSSGVYSVAAVDLAALADGAATLTVVSTDPAGNSGNGSDTVFKDVVVPTVTIAQPVNASVVNATGTVSLNVSGTCSDNGAAVNLTLGSTLGSATCAGGVYSTNVNVTAEVDGSLPIAADILDSVGNYGSNAVIVTKDATPPTAVITGLPTSIVLGTSVGLTVSPGDVVQYRYAVSNIAQSDCMNIGNYSASLPVATPLDVSTPTPALYFVCVIGIDAAGNEQIVATPTIERLTKGPVVISFVERWSSAPENVGLRSLAIDISPILSTPVSLDIEVQGTATQGIQYSGFFLGRENIMVPAFTSAHSVDVSVIGGSVGNLEKRLSVSLKGSPNTQGILIGEKQVHELWIEDFDFAPTPLDKIVVGSTHSCGISIAGKLFCWGRDTSGALGDGGGNVDQLYPVPIDAANNYLEVAVGNYSTCAIRTDNSLYCWGNNTTGQLGIGNLISMNVPTLTGTGYVKVAKGLSSACGLKTDGSVKCWGSQNNGRVGNSLSAGDALLPVAISIGGTAVDVSVGYDHACAIRSDGATLCWGGNAIGQIGNGNTMDVLTPLEIVTGGGMVQVTGGQYYTCTLRADGKAFCWGQGSSGKLGQGAGTNSSLPVASQAAYNFNSIKAGANTTCGIDQADSRLKCWGYGYYGLLGDGVRRGSSMTPVDASLLPGMTTHFSLNATNACAVSQGKGFCWGGNSNNHLGTGNISKTAIVSLAPLVDFASVSLGRGGCGITPAGALWCWGANDLDSIFATGNVGDGTTITRDAMVHVDPGVTYFSVSFGTRHTCGITTSNLLKCWGMNTGGQLGIGNTIGQNLPVPVAAGFLSVSVGTTSTCAIDMSNKLFCWGNNADGQLGLGSTTSHDLPQSVMPATDFSSVSVGANTACAVTVANDLYCWGNNNKGQVGDGTTVNVTTPFLVVSSVQKVSVGAEATCYINNASSLYCWGRNASAEIGQGATSPPQYTSPMMVGSSYNDVKVGKNMKTNGPGTHVCALTNANTVNCWGASVFGQNFPAVAPVVSPSLFEAGTFTAVETGELQTCAKPPAGYWRCRGAADDGQLPLGYTSRVPQLVPRVRFQ